MDSRTYGRTAHRNVLCDKICRPAPPAPWQKKNADLYRASLAAGQPSSSVSKQIDTREHDCSRLRADES